jgi:hypothetical protein
LARRENAGFALRQASFGQAPSERGIVRVGEIVMNTFLRFLQVFALGAWVGSIIYFSAVVAQGAFRTLPSIDDAGRLVGFTLAGLHTMGVIAAVIYLVATAALGLIATVAPGRPFAAMGKALVQPAAIGVILMLAMTLISARIVIPRMDVLRAQMGSVAATAASSPLRAEFDRLHGVSVKLEGAVLLAGIASLFLTVRSRLS